LNSVNSRWSAIGHRVFSRETFAFIARLATVMLLVSFASYAILELTPGDPALSYLGPEASPEQLAEVRAELGLDKPMLERYFDWLGGVLQGDFGTSLSKPVEPVSTKIARAFPVSAQIAVMGILLALIVAVPLATYQAYRAGSRADRTISSVMFGLFSIPGFLIAFIFILLFVRWWPILPRAQWVRPSIGGWAENMKHALLPILSVSLVPMAVFTRVLRSDMMSTMQQDYVLAARSRGLSTRRVLLRHTIRPSLFSFVTLVGISFGAAIGGTVIMETIFALPGMGRLIVEAAAAGDYPVVQGGVFVIAFVYVLINAVVDLMYQLIDPRVRIHG
jgi:peptide/nickel transport system permease protein